MVVTPERPLRCGIIGIGARGRSFIKRLASVANVEIAWLVDVSADRLDMALALAGERSPRITRETAEAFADSSLAAVLIATPDHLHAEQAIAAFAAGKHVFLEKPLATTLADGRAVLSARAKSGRVLRLGYVLREALLFRSVRQAITEGRVGRVLSIRLADDLSVLHGASYRRRWHRRSAASGGLMVHKGCHDLDLICWLLATRPTRVASFGAADLFARAPPAPFCSVCPERGVCPYVDTGAYEARTPAETADPTAHGLDVCVFGDDSDLVDRQVVAFEMASGAQGVFSLAMGNPGRSDRTFTIVGDAGRIDGRFGEGRWTLTPIRGEPATWSPGEPTKGGHGGGDEGVLRAFLRACAVDGPVAWSDEADEDALRGLAFALAAETARKTGRVAALGADMTAGAV
ncbi:MAG: Gfo/Idh/MocA family oxidoreductase [Caulobacteraceae bacterium]